MKDGYNIYTDFSKKIILNKGNINNFLNFKNLKKKNKELDLFIGFFSYEILCSLLNIKIKNQKKLNFYKGVFYKPETVIQIRDKIRVISSKKKIYLIFFFTKHRFYHLLKKI